MRNLLAFVAGLVLTVAGVGLYLDWYKIRTAPGSAGRRTVNIDINTEKIGDDLREGGEYLLEQGGEKIHEIIEKRRKEQSAPEAESGKSDAAPGAIHGPPRPKEEEPLRRTGLVLPPDIEFEF